MGFVIGLLTLIMVVDCVVLVFLVLIQLPKKEAGAGLAFGGAASDALFGAGSGTVLTKITKYAATIFFVLAIVLSIMQSRYSRRSSSFLNEIKKAGSTQVSPMAPATPTTPANPATTPGPTPVPGSNAAAAPAPSASAPQPAAETPAPQK